MQDQGSKPFPNFQVVRARSRVCILKLECPHAFIRNDKRCQPPAAINFHFFPADKNTAELVVVLKVKFHRTKEVIVQPIRKDALAGPRGHESHARGGRVGHVGAHGAIELGACFRNAVVSAAIQVLVIALITRTAVVGACAARA